MWRDTRRRRKKNQEGLFIFRFLLSATWEEDNEPWFRYPRRAPVECLPHQHTNRLSARAVDRSQITLPGKSQRQFAYYYYRSRKRYWEGKTYDTWVVTETRTSVLFDGVENPIYICRVFYYIRQSVTKEERNETKRNPRGWGSSFRSTLYARKRWSGCVTQPTIQQHQPNGWKRQMKGN